MTNKPVFKDLRKALWRQAPGGFVQAAAVLFWNVVGFTPVAHLIKMIRQEPS